MTTNVIAFHLSSPTLPPREQTERSMADDAEELDWGGVDDEDYGN